MSIQPRYTVGICQVCEKSGDLTPVAIDIRNRDLTAINLDPAPRTAGAPRRYGVNACRTCTDQLVALLYGWRLNKEGT